MIKKNDFVNIFCNDKPQQILLNPDSENEKAIVFDQKTLQNFTEIVKLWTENQLKINFQKLSARNKKTTVSSRPRNPRARGYARTENISRTQYKREIDDAKNDKYWKYMDRIFCLRNKIPYSPFIDATPRYSRRNVRERSKPYPVEIFYIK